MRRKTAVFGVVVAAAITTAATTVVANAAAAEPDLANPQVVATGLSVPWGLGFLPNGDALVTERTTGLVKRLRQGSAPVTVATISGVQANQEAGLLGLAVSPTYATDGFIYVYFTAANDNRIVRFTLANPTNQQVILSGLAKGAIHDGGRIRFSPTDGKLYAGVGDANNRALPQDDNSRNGKILRLNPDGSVPADNPTPGSLVFSKGHRNVQGLAFDASGELYSSEFGQDTWDEVNHIVGGHNYGWPTVEGQANNPAFDNPIVVWRTSEASPSGATIDGSTFYTAALRGQRLWSVPLNGNGGAGTPTSLLQGTYGRLRTVERAPDGALWVTTSNTDGRGSPRPGDDQVIRFPAAS